MYSLLPVPKPGLDPPPEDVTGPGSRLPPALLLLPPEFAHGFMVLPMPFLGGGDVVEFLFEYEEGESGRGRASALDMRPRERRLWPRWSDGGFRGVWAAAPLTQVSGARFLG